MLYVSTRNTGDAFTAYRALHEERTPDGGLFVPYRLPYLSEKERAELNKKTFCEIVAKILNIFFPVAMTGWDVEFCIGRIPYRLHTMSHRLVIGELWHNMDSDYAFWVRSLYHKLCDKDKIVHSPAGWAKIAINIAVLFGIFSQLQIKNGHQVDLALTTGDFSGIMAAWYARKMGLPIGTIICTSTQYGGAWELFSRGELSIGNMRTDELLPNLDVPKPRSLERLIYETIGITGVNSYLTACDNSGTFHLDEEQLPLFNGGMVGAVVSRERCESLIRSIYKTHNYVADPYLAIAFGGLQDYRSRSSEVKSTLLLSVNGPAVFEPMIARATGISTDSMK